METVSRQRELGQESVQLRALNERLECYLQRVAVLEKENSTLRDHIQALKLSADGGRRKELEAELEALRQELAEGFRETDRAALQRDALLEEVRLVAERCCGEARLRTSAEKELAERRRWLEEEQRGWKGLEGKVRMFQDELGHLEEVQREERNVLLQERARNSLRCPTAPVAAISPPDLRLCLGEVDLKWTEARDLYREELTRLERVVSEAGLRQEAAREETRLNRHRLQGLRGELEAHREKKRQLEMRMKQQNKASEQDTQRLQATVGELERERQTLAAKMEQIVEEQRQLMQMKLALSLEVATYRALLDTEAQRIHLSAGARGLPASLRDAQLGFPAGKRLSTEKHSAPVRLESGNAWRTVHPGAVTVPSGWKERNAFGDAAPMRTEPSADRAAGKAGNGSVETWPGEFLAERDLVDGVSAQDVPLGGSAKDEADKCPTDDRRSETPNQVDTETKLFTKPAEHPPLSGLLNGDIAEPGADRERLHLPPPLSTRPESAPEDSGHSNIGAAQFNGELRDPVEGDSDSDSLREALDSAGCQSDNFGEVTERPVEIALSRQGISEARPGKETQSGSGEGRWSEEAVVFIKEEELAKEEGASGEDQCPTAANAPWEDSAREARPEKLETRRLSVEMERIRDQDDEEMTAESLLHGGEETTNTHATNDPVDRGSGDGAVEAGVVGESEAGYPEGSGAEEGQLSESFQEPEVEVTRSEKSQTDKKVCAILVHEYPSSGEELSAVMEEVVLMEPPAAEDRASEGWSSEMPGETIRQHPAEGSPEVKEEKVFGKKGEDHAEPRTEGMEAEPRSEAVDAPLRWEEMAEVIVDSEGSFSLETVPTREGQEVEVRAPTSVSAEEPADYPQEDRDGKPRENPEKLLTVVTPVEEQFEAAPAPWTERMEAELRSEQIDSPLRWEKPTEERTDLGERASPERVCSSEEQAVEKRVPTLMGADDTTRHPQGDRDDEPRENSDESLSLGPRAEEEEEVETAPERSTERMETESWPEAMDVPLRREETAEKRVDSERTASPVRFNTREEQEMEERVPAPVRAEEPACHPQGDQDNESQEDPLCFRPRAEEQCPEAIDAPLQCEETPEARLVTEGRASPVTVSTCEEPEVEVSVPTPLCADETADHSEGDRGAKPRENAVESPHLGSRAEEEEEVEPVPELWTERLETEPRPEATDSPFEWEETAEMRVDSEVRASSERATACEELTVEVRVPKPICVEETENNQQGERDGEPQEKSEVSLGFGPRGEDQEEEAVPRPSTEGLEMPRSDAALRLEETVAVRVDSEGRATKSEEAEAEVRIPTVECANEPADHLQGDRDSEPCVGPEESRTPESTALEEIRDAPEPWTVGLEAQSLPEEEGVPLIAEERMEGSVIPDRVTSDEKQAVEQRELTPVCAEEPTEEDLQGRVIPDRDTPDEAQAVEQRVLTPVCAEEPTEEDLQGRVIPDRDTPDEAQAVEQRELTPVCAEEPTEEDLQGRAIHDRVTPDEAQAVEKRALTPVCADEQAEERLELRAFPDRVTPEEEQALEQRTLMPVCADVPADLQGDRESEPQEKPEESPDLESRAREEIEEPRPEAMDVPLWWEETAAVKVDSEGRASYERVTSSEEAEAEVRIPTVECANEPADHLQGDRDSESCVGPEESRTHESTTHEEIRDAPEPWTVGLEAQSLPEEESVLLKAEKRMEGSVIPDRDTPDEAQAVEQRELTPVCAEEPTEEDLQGRAIPDRVTPDEAQAVEKRALTPVCADVPADHLQGDRESEPQEKPEESPDLESWAREELEEPRPEALDVPLRWEETAEARVDSEGRASSERATACEELTVEVRVPKPICVEEPADHQQGEPDGEPQEKPEVSLGFGPRREDQDEEAVPRPSTEGLEMPRWDAALRLEETAAVKVDSEGRASYERVTSSEEAEAEVRIPTVECANEPADHLQGDRDSEPCVGPEESRTPESTTLEEIRDAPEPWTVGLEAQSLPEEEGVPLIPEEGMEGSVIPDRVTPDEAQAVEQRELTPVCAEEPTEEDLQGRAIPDRVTPDEAQAVEKRALTPVCADEQAEERLELRAIPERVTPEEEQALEQRTLTPVCADVPADLQGDRESEPQEKPEESPDLESRAREELEEPRPEAIDVPLRWEETAEAWVDSEGRASPERVTACEELTVEVSALKLTCVEEPADNRQEERVGESQKKPEVLLGLGPRGEDQEVETVPGPSTEGKEIPRSEIMDAPLRWVETSEVKVDSEEKAGYEKDTSSKEPEVDEKVQTVVDAEESADYPQGDRDSEPRESPEELLTCEFTADEVILAAPEPWTMGMEAESQPEEVGVPLPAEERMEGRAIPDIDTADVEQAVEQTAITPVYTEERMEARTIVDIVTPDEEPTNLPQGYGEAEPRENSEDLVTPEFPAKVDEVPGAPGLNFGEEAGTVPGDDGERKEWAGEFEDEAAQDPEPGSIQGDAGQVQEEGAVLKTAAIGEEESIGAKDTGFSQANLETGDQETVIRKDQTDLDVAEEELERGWADQAEIPGEVSEPETEERNAEIEEEPEPAIKLRTSVSAVEDTPQVKSISLGEMELAEDEDTFRVEEVGAGEEVLLASAELTEPREEMSATASAPDGPEEKGISTLPVAPSLGEKPEAQEDQALRDSPEGAEDRALPPPSLSNILPETPGTEDQSLAEWREAVVQPCALPSQGTDVQDSSIPWEERPDGCQLIEGFLKESPGTSAVIESPGQASDVTHDLDAEDSPTGRLTLEDSTGIDGLGTEEAESVENVDNFQDAEIPNCPGDPTTRIQQAKGEKPATAPEQIASTGFLTPGILLPDQTEIQVAANPELQRVDSDRHEMADQERPQGQKEAEDQYAPSLELAAERPGLEKDGGCPLEEREKVTLRIEADESDSEENEPHGPPVDLEENLLKVGARARIGSNSLDSQDVAAGSGEGGIPVEGEGQTTEPQPMNEVWKAASCPETLSYPEDLEPLVNRPRKVKDEGDGGSVDLLLIPQEASPSRNLFLAPQSTSSAQDTWTTEDQEPRPDTPLVTNERHLNGLHDYSEVPDKSDGRAVEMIATAYHYWSSEDE